ncbi:MAG TPA: S8 family serine peptidase, partial [Sumerlaeia bacterium]|nr:S8 family serine peptidase [Sumerlaeia bacterium]
MGKHGFLPTIALAAAIVSSGGPLAPVFAAGPLWAQHVPGELVVEYGEGVAPNSGGESLKERSSYRRAAEIASSRRPASLVALDRRFRLREGRPLFTVRRSWAEAAGRTARWELGAPSLSSNTWLLRFDPGVDVAEARKAYENDPNVVYAELNYTGSLSYTPGNDPLYAQAQANLALIGMEAAWEVKRGADSSVVVAVIDSGVDLNHPEFDGVIHPASHNFTDVLTPESVFDDHGHGTRVAGVIAATENNGEGIVGIAFGCRIMSLDVATSSGQTSASDVSEAINWAVANGAHVINMSFGFSARSTLMENACAAAAAANILLVGAAGNANQCSFPEYPASFETVIGVGAVMDLLGTLIRAPWSNYNGEEKSLVELVAPGEKIFSTIPASQYDGLYGSGTSFAAPMVSGLAALLKSKNPSQSARAIRAHLGATAAPQGDWAGAGLVDAATALSTEIPPNLHIVDYRIDDATTRSMGVNNEDGRLQAGETAVLHVELENRWGDAANVTATLSNPDSRVTVTDSTAGWNNVGSFVRSLTSDDYTEVQIDAAAGAGATTFHLAILSDTAAYSRTRDFTVPIESLLTLTTTTIGSDTTWTSDKTYLIQGTITVASGATLTVDPGTIVRFAVPNAGLEVQSGGGIRAEGT